MSPQPTTAVGRKPSCDASVAQIQQGDVDEWVSENAVAIADLTAAADEEESERIGALAHDLGVE